MEFSPKPYKITSSYFRNYRQEIVDMQLGIHAQKAWKLAWTWKLEFQKVSIFVIKANMLKLRTRKMWKNLCHAHLWRNWGFFIHYLKLGLGLINKKKGWKTSLLVTRSYLVIFIFYFHTFCPREFSELARTI